MGFVLMGVRRPEELEFLFTTDKWFLAHPRRVLEVLQKWRRRLADEEAKDNSMEHQIRCSMMRCASRTFQSRHKAIRHCFARDALAELRIDEAGVRRASVALLRCTNREGLGRFSRTGIRTIRDVLGRYLKVPEIHQQLLDVQVVYLQGFVHKRQRRCQTSWLEESLEVVRNEFESFSAWLRNATCA